MTNCDDHLIGEATKLVTGMGKMFAPFCEVVLHDLRTPEQAIVAIELM
jgi:predicted transcriptional regulator YheO